LKVWWVSKINKIKQYILLWFNYWTNMAQIPYNVQGIGDLPRLQQELMKNWNIQWASQASQLLNQYSKDKIIPDTIGSIYSNYYNNLFQPSNQAYAQVLWAVDADYKNKIGWLFNEANAQYGPDGLLKKQMEDYYNQQAIATANRFGGQQSLNAALAAKQWLDPNQVNVWANQLASQQNDEMLKFRQWQLWALDNLTKTYLDFYNRYNDQYANSNDKYVVQTAQQLKQIRDALTNTALNQELQKDMMKYQKSLAWGGGSWGTWGVVWLTPEEIAKKTEEEKKTMAINKLLVDTVRNIPLWAMANVKARNGPENKLNRAKWLNKK